MARYTGPAYKKSRRYGFSTLENGKDLAKRPYAPGQHGAGRRKKISEYGIQLQEKQEFQSFLYFKSVIRKTQTCTTQISAFSFFRNI